METLTKTKWIKIVSQGIIDPKAFHLIGASTKRDDKTKIGFFGSGLKYSLAYLLRNKINFRVFSDFKEFSFTTEATPFRGDKWFDVICIDGIPTSLTTEMGIDWEAWFIIREIYCNALDEGGSRISRKTEEPLPIQDHTVFYIDQAPFIDIVENWGLYFSEGRPEQDLIFTDDRGNKYFRGGENRINYRKGIRCDYVPDKRSLFNYDTQWVQINESRTIKSDWDFSWNLVAELKKSTSTTIISQILCQVNNTWEKSLHWDFHSFSDTWLDCVGDKTLVAVENAGFWIEEMKANPMAYIELPSMMVTGLKDQFADQIKVIGEAQGNIKMPSKTLEPTEKQNYLLNAALEFLKKAKYNVENPCSIVRFNDPNLMGLADMTNKKILLSEKIFDKGQKYVVTTIMEENEHLVSRLQDETRGFQNHLFEKWVSTMEQFTQTWL